jgi:hypothetical protein
MLTAAAFVAGWIVALWHRRQADRRRYLDALDHRLRMLDIQALPRTLKPSHMKRDTLTT